LERASVAISSSRDVVKRCGAPQPVVRRSLPQMGTVTQHTPRLCIREPTGLPLHWRAVLPSLPVGFRHVD
jgi:hypothetical protein